MRKFKVKSGNEYTFVNESWSTRGAWGHKTRLFKNDEEISSSKVRYYNRTWEAYQFRTSMMIAVEKLIEEELAEVIRTNKERHGIKRLKKSLRDKWTNEYNEGSELLAVKDSL